MHLGGGCPGQQQEDRWEEEDGPHRRSFPPHSNVVEEYDESRTEAEKRGGGMSERRLGRNRGEIEERYGRERGG
jgi:hypothetical protein